jgi:Matrixin
MASEPSANSILQPTDSEEQAMLEAWILQMQETQAAVTPSLDLPALVAQVNNAASYDRVQIRNSTGRHLPIFPGNIASAALGLLSQQKGYNWNGSSPVSVVTVLNKPKYGKLIRDGQNNFGYDPQRLGTEYLRFIVQNEEGRKMIVTWRIDVRADLEVGQVSPEQGAQYAEYRIPLVDKNNLNAWFQSAQLSALLASAIQTLTGFTDLSSTALGQTTGEGASASITLDTNAAGHGWYIDPTPLDPSTSSGLANSDYLPTSDATVWQAKAGSAAAGKMDMLSVLLHEYGHALGLEHSGNGADFMAASLQPGVRKLPSSEELALMSQLVAQLKAEQGAADAAALTPALS